MANQPIRYEPQPSLLQDAQDVHKPDAAAPGSRAPTDSGLYQCLSRYCESAFPNTEDLDLHYKIVHCPPLLGFEGASLANNIISTAGELLPLFPNFHPDANIAQNGFGKAIGAPLHDPFVGYVGYNEISANEHDGELLSDEGSFREALRMRQSSPSPALITPELRSLVPVEAGSTTFNPPVSLPTSSISPAAPPLPTPTTETLPPSRHVCATCSQTFGRVQDMQRHSKKHDPNAQRIDCPFPNCPYKGARGFLRNDKLTSHWQNRHQ